MRSKAGVPLFSFFPSPFSFLFVLLRPAANASGRRTIVAMQKMIAFPSPPFPLSFLSLFLFRCPAPGKISRPSCARPMGRMASPPQKGRARFPSPPFFPFSTNMFVRSRGLGRQFLGDKGEGHTAFFLFSPSSFSLPDPTSKDPPNARNPFSFV